MSNLHGTMPWEASPCGTVMERDRVLLFTQAERVFTALRDVEPRIYENLLAPWHVKGEAVGTLWAIKHTPEGRFDAEDARVLQTLARSAGAAFQMISAIDAATVRQVELEQRTDALVEVEERQSFLLTLSDAVRPLAGPADIQGETTRLLREKLNVGWCYYVDWDLDRKIGLVLRDSAREGLPSLAGAHDVSDAPEFLRLLASGTLLTVSNYEGYEQLPTRIRQNFTGLGFRSMMLAPLVKEGRLIATLIAGDTEIRDWSTSDETLLVEVAERTWAAVERAHVEGALRESEARLAQDLEATQVLQRIGDELVSTSALDGHFARICEAARTLMRSDAASVQVYDHPSSRLRLAGHVGFHLDSAAFWAWVDAGTASACGRALNAGERVVLADVDTFEADPGDHEAWRKSGIRSVQSTPLVTRRGQMVGMMSTHWRHPHQPTNGDYRFFDILARLVADFIERTRAEAALAESEERFRQFADASAAGLWIRKANRLEMEFASPALATIYGVDDAGLLGDVKRWAALIVPEERDAAVEHLEAARDGKTAQHEVRIRRPSDGAFRWIRDTSFPLEDVEGKIERIGGIAEDITEAKLAVGHQGVLLAELQHRVRNIMAMIRSMALRTADGAVDVADYRSLLEGRLMALARVQVLLTREANTGGLLRDIVASEVSAQAQRDDQFELDGPEIRLSPKVTEVLTLALHELTTNALKYGAFSVPDGRLRVSWKPFEKRGRAWLALDWTETGVPSRQPSIRRGFGSDLIEGRIPYEIGGTGKITLEPGGAHCQLKFPLKEGESVLETDAPMPTTLFGGSLDMKDAPDLTGRKVLVVEDDYYIAGDTAAALRGAGAEVLGPCPSEDATLDLLETRTPSHAVLDLNLGGGGPRFEIARVLSKRGVPFLFMTGYDPDKIPPELEDVPRLQKPVTFRTIVEAVAQLQ